MVPFKWSKCIQVNCTIKHINVSEQTVPIDAETAAQIWWIYKISKIPRWFGSNGYQTWSGSSTTVSGFLKYFDTVVINGKE